MTEYKIHALRYAGPFTGSGALLTWLRDWDVVMERAYYIWLVSSGDEAVVVDSGCAPDLAREKSLVGYVNPVELLSRVGIRAEDIRHLILTHMHWDHVSGVAQFPNARIYLQKEEYRFWTSDPMAQHPVFRQFADDRANAYLTLLEGTPRLELLEGDRQILPGITCLSAPGHTIGHQAVAVDTQKGKAVIGSDCAHTFVNFQQEWPSAIIHDLPAWIHSFKKLKAHASDDDLLFPGHDILMDRNYPHTAEGVSRLA